MTEDDAKRIAADVVAEMLNDPRTAETLTLVCHDLWFTECGEPVPVYGAESAAGYGAYSCEYWPTMAAEKLVEECERIYDGQVLTRKAGGKVAERMRLKDLPAEFNDKYRAEIIGLMRELAIRHLFTNLRAKLNMALWLNYEEAKAIAGGVLGLMLSRALESSYGAADVDGREVLRDLVNECADKERRHLKESFSALPGVIAEGRRGRRKGPQTITTDVVRGILRGKPRASAATVARFFDREESAVKRWAKGAGWKNWKAAKAALLKEIKTGHK